MRRALARLVRPVHDVSPGPKRSSRPASLPKPCDREALNPHRSPRRVRRARAGRRGSPRRASGSPERSSRATNRPRTERSARERVEVVRGHGAVDDRELARGRAPQRSASAAVSISQPGSISPVSTTRSDAPASSAATAASAASTWAEPAAPVDRRPCARRSGGVAIGTASAVTAPPPTVDDRRRRARRCARPSRAARGCPGSTGSRRRGRRGSGPAWRRRRPSRASCARVTGRWSASSAHCSPVSAAWMSSRCVPPSSGTRKPASAAGPQLRAVNAAPQTVTPSPSGVRLDARRARTRARSAGQSVRCQTDPGRYGSWFPGAISTGTRGPGEAVAQEGDRVLADVLVLVDVARDADRVDRHARARARARA